MERQTFFDPQRKVIALAVAASGVAAFVGWGLSTRQSALPGSNGSIPASSNAASTGTAQTNGLADTSAVSVQTSMASLSPTDFLAAIPDPVRLDYVS